MGAAKLEPNTVCVSGRENSRRVGRREKEVYKTGKKSRAAAGLSFRIRSFRGKFRTCSIFKECLSFPSPPQGLNWLWGWKGKEKRRVVLVYFRFPQSTVELFVLFIRSHANRSARMRQLRFMSVSTFLYVSGTAKFCLVLHSLVHAV